MADNRAGINHIWPKIQRSFLTQAGTTKHDLVMFMWHSTRWYLDRSIDPGDCDVHLGRPEPSERQIMKPSAIVRDGWFHYSGACIVENPSIALE
jgi:hypothetical protein